MQRKQSRVWQSTHAEQHRATTKEWELRNPGREKILVKAWVLKNPERLALDHLNWRLANPERARADERTWHLSHPEQEAAKSRKHLAKRRRLGFVPMNQPIVGAEAHHIDKERVIYIPKDLHRSIPHDVWTGKNMDKINAEAFNYLFKQEVNHECIQH
ncbi:MAG: hypothetical protein WC455_25360 [Dehalococcoidia bacterium]